MKQDIMQLIDSGEYQEYVSMAHELIDEGNTPERVVAALLKYTFKDELKENAYREISESSNSVDTKGTARLFVALGREQDYTPANLAKFLEEEGGISQNAIRDIKVYDKFSFITVAFVEAEQLLAVFSKNRGGRKPLVTKAKERDGGSGGGGQRDRGPRNFESRGPRENRDSQDNSSRPARFSDDKKQFSQKPEFRKPERTERPERVERPETDKKEVAKPAFNAEGKPIRKRENKLTDYLDKKPVEKVSKPTNKKSDTSEVDKFLKNHEDDLSW
jgi:ATP-dependent RNA helicase DeaD